MGCTTKVKLTMVIAKLGKLCCKELSHTCTCIAQHYGNLQQKMPSNHYILLQAFKDYWIQNIPTTPPHPTPPWGTSIEQHCRFYHLIKKSCLSLHRQCRLEIFCGKWLADDILTNSHHSAWVQTCSSFSFSHSSSSSKQLCLVRPLQINSLFLGPNRPTIFIDRVENTKNCITRNYGLNWSNYGTNHVKSEHWWPSVKCWKDGHIGLHFSLCPRILSSSHRPAVDWMIGIRALGFSS